MKHSFTVEVYSASKAMHQDDEVKLVNIEAGSDVGHVGFIVGADTTPFFYPGTKIVVTVETEDE